MQEIENVNIQEFSRDFRLLVVYDKKIQVTILIKKKKNCRRTWGRKHIFEEYEYNSVFQCYF